MKKWNKERFATIWEKLESMIALRSLRARIFLLTLVIGLVPCIAMRHGIVSRYSPSVSSTKKYLPCSLPAVA